MQDKRIAIDYILYLNTINYFNNLPLWLKELYSYENEVKNNITLSPSDTNAAHKAFSDLSNAVITKKKGIKLNAELCL